MEQKERAGRPPLERGALYVVGTPIGNLGDFLPPGPGDPGRGGLYRRGGPPGSPCGCSTTLASKKPLGHLL